MLVAGTNCWRIAAADRAAFLVDAQAYFDALRAAIAAAREVVVIIGWDIDSRTPIGPAGPGGPQTLLAFLNEVLDRRPGLRVFALAWDFSLIYTLERETLPTYRFAWSGHPRLHFRLDAAHPVGASQHQKIVVVDDRVAFAGGLDLTIRRWDTPAHRADDPRRVDPTGRPYPPIHDVQMMVDGPAAAALADLARGRWRAATGFDIPPVRAGAAADPWPEAVLPDARAVPIGIARTQSPIGDAPAVHEIATLTVQAIAAARRWIYIENQFLTAAAVGAALARRLADPESPEVVVVLPREQHGWLEQSSMGILRARLLHRLLASDRHRRLKLVHPVVPDLGGGCVNVHAKVMIVDDALARIGSANLSNRSMGLDSECDLVLDAALDPALAPAIAALRSRLLAEHLDVAPEAVAAATAAGDSLIGAVDALSGRPRSLAPLPLPPDPADAELRAIGPTSPTPYLTFLDGLVCDPERPAPDQLIETLVPTGLRRPVRRWLTAIALVAAVVGALAAIWRFTPLDRLLEVERLAALGRALRGHPAAPLATLGAFLVGGLVFFPITLLIAATAVVFPPGEAILLSLAGTLVSAAATYWIGRAVGRFRGGWLNGPRTRRFRGQLRRRGLVAVVAARLFPVGNFTLINMTAGALGVRFFDYMLGNAIGILPGLLALTVFADRLGHTWRHPHPANIIWLLLVLLIFFGAISWLQRRLGHRR